MKGLTYLIIAGLAALACGLAVAGADPEPGPVIATSVTIVDAHGRDLIHLTGKGGEPAALLKAPNGKSSLMLSIGKDGVPCVMLTGPGPGSITINNMPEGPVAYLKDGAGNAVVIGADPEHGGHLIIGNKAGRAWSAP